MSNQSTSSFDERIEILIQELELAIKWRRPCVLLVAYSSEYVRMEVETALENYLIDYLKTYGYQEELWYGYTPHELVRKIMQTNAMNFYKRFFV